MASLPSQASEWKDPKAIGAVFWQRRPRHFQVPNRCYALSIQYIYMFDIVIDMHYQYDTALPITPIIATISHLFGPNQPQVARNLYLEPPKRSMCTRHASAKPDSKKAKRQDPGSVLLLQLRCSYFIRCRVKCIDSCGILKMKFLEQIFDSSHVQTKCSAPTRRGS